MSAPFDVYTSDDVHALIAEYPLAWIVAQGTAEASLLPVLAEYDDEERLVSLFGHMSRRNPLHRLLADTPAVTILFNGPQGYVSPEHAGKRDWGPTWNYAQLTIAAEVSFVPEENDSSLTALTQAVEGDRWTTEELGARYAGMARAIIAFRARVITLQGRFKLAQDEEPAVLAALLRNHPNAALVRWMRRLNAARLPEPGVIP